MRKLQPFFFENKFKQIIDNFRKGHGITCFSKTYKNALMWSHYADKHKGVCIGFDFQTEKIYENFLLFKVRYSTKIEPVSFFEKKELINFKWIYTKSKDWEYEEEIRAITYGKVGLQKFDINKVNEIYFGINSSSEDIQDINNILLTKKIKPRKISKLNMAKQQYKIEEDN